MGTVVLHLDDELIHRIEAYSATTGRSVSELVADYLAASSPLSAPAPDRVSIK